MLISLQKFDVSEKKSLINEINFIVKVFLLCTNSSFIVRCRLIIKKIMVE